MMVGFVLHPVIRKTRDVLRRLTQLYGTKEAKKRLWDEEYASGRWDCLVKVPEDCFYSYVERHARGGSILDLGCGPAATGHEIRADSYNVYTGVDISEVAIEKARQISEELGRGAKNEYRTSDIYTYVPERTYDVIAFGDSIYYIAERKILGMLNRYLDHLNHGGVFMARIRAPRPSMASRPSILRIIEGNFRTVEKSFHCDGEVCVIVFQALDSANSGRNGTCQNGRGEKP